jgi:hypothetical protein
MVRTNCTSIISMSKFLWHTVHVASIDGICQRAFNLIVPCNFKFVNHASNKPAIELDSRLVAFKDIFLRPANCDVLQHDMLNDGACMR